MTVGGGGNDYASANVCAEHCKAAAAAANDKFSGACQSTITPVSFVRFEYPRFEAPATFSLARPPMTDGSPPLTILHCSFRI